MVGAYMKNLGQLCGEFRICNGANILKVGVLNPTSKGY